MKKITSILCALVIALSASAAPQVSVKKAFQAKHGFELSKKTIAEKGAVKKAHFPKAATEITIVECSGEYYDDDELFVYTLVDADGIEYYFAFPTTEDIESGKTYTLADMDETSCYWVDWETWDYAGFTAVTFLKTEDGNGGMKVVVNATDENGTEFVLTYEFKVTGETITLDVLESVTKPEYYNKDGDWYFGGHTAAYEFSLDIYGAEASLVGEYTFEDFETYYTYIYDVENEMYLSVKDAKASITAGQNDTLRINAEILASDGVKYVIKAFYAAPSALAQETITADMEIVKGEYEYGWYVYDKYEFSAADDKNAVDFTWIDWDDAGNCLGTFDVTDFSGFAVTPAGKDYSNAASGSVTIASADDKITVTGIVLCYNNVAYTLNLTGTVAQAVENTEVAQKAVKRIENGQIVIEKNGELYNVLGTVVK